MGMSVRLLHKRLIFSGRLVNPIKSVENVKKKSARVRCHQSLELGDRGGYSAISRRLRNKVVAGGCFYLVGESVINEAQFMGRRR